MKKFPWLIYSAIIVEFERERERERDKNKCVYFFCWVILCMINHNLSNENDIKNGMECSWIIYLCIYSVHDLI